MTADHNTPESVANGESDALVTQTYRKVAAQRAPEHLNQAILKEAANATRPRYSRLITWTRPMAWAATVMLSVALVLQIAKVPTPEAVTFERVSSKLELASPEIEKAGGAPTELLEESRPPAVPPGRKINADANAPSQAEVVRSTAKQTPLKSVSGKRQRSKLQQERVNEQEMPAAAASMSLESAATTACSEGMTTTPESWLECIEDLEKAGRVEEANQQRRQLQVSFPDFELP